MQQTWTYKIFLIIFQTFMKDMFNIPKELIFEQKCHKFIMILICLQKWKYLDKLDYQMELVHKIMDMILWEI